MSLQHQRVLHPNELWNSVSIRITKEEDRLLVANSLWLPVLTQYLEPSTVVVGNDTRENLLIAGRMSVACTDPMTFINRLTGPTPQTWINLTTPADKEKVVTFLTQLVFNEVYRDADEIPVIQTSPPIRSLVASLDINATDREKGALMNFLETLAGGTLSHELLKLKWIDIQAALLVEFEDQSREKAAGTLDHARSLHFDPDDAEIQTYLKAVESWYEFLARPKTANIIDVGLTSLLNKYNCYATAATYFSNRNMPCETLKEFQTYLGRATISMRDIYEKFLRLIPHEKRHAAVKAMLADLDLDSDTVQNNYYFENYKATLDETTKELLRTHGITYTKWMKIRDNKEERAVVTNENIPGALTANEVRQFDTICGIQVSSQPLQTSSGSFVSEVDVFRSNAKRQYTAIENTLVAGGRFGKRNAFREGDKLALKNLAEGLLGRPIPFLFINAIMNFDFYGMGLMAHSLTDVGYQRMLDLANYNSDGQGEMVIGRRINSLGAYLTVRALHDEFELVTGGTSFNNTDSEIMLRNLGKLSARFMPLMERLQVPNLFPLMVRMVETVVDICHQDGLERDSRSTMDCVGFALTNLGRDQKAKNMLESIRPVSVFNNTDIRTVIGRCEAQIRGVIDTSKFKRQQKRFEDKRSNDNGRDKKQGNDNNNSNNNNDGRNNGRDKKQGNNNNNSNNNNNNNNGNPAKKTKYDRGTLGEVKTRCRAANPPVNMAIDGRVILTETYNLNNACLWCVLHNLTGTSHNYGNADRLHQRFNEVKKNPQNLNSIDKFIKEVQRVKEDE